MFPVRFRQNLIDELAGGFADENTSGAIPSGFATDDGGSGSVPEFDEEPGGNSDSEN
jgi:hypothetical protein